MSRSEDLGAAPGRGAIVRAMHRPAPPMASSHRPSGCWPIRSTGTTLRPEWPALRMRSGVTLSAGTMCNHGNSCMQFCASCRERRPADATAGTGARLARGVAR